MAPHSSTLAWKISRMEEPGRLQSMGSLRVWHDRVTSLSLFTFMHWRRNWQLTPVFLPGESRDGGAWWAVVCGVAQSQTRLKQLSSSRSIALVFIHFPWVLKKFHSCFFLNSFYKIIFHSWNVSSNYWLLNEGGNFVKITYNIRYNRLNKIQ